MKTLLFDLLNAQPIGSSKFHGGGEYIKRVFDRLVQEYSKIIRIIAFYDHDKFLDEWLIKLMEDYRIETVNVKSIYELPNVFSNNKIDLFYTGLPYEYRTEILPKGVYKVATFHGMRAVECPHDEYEYKYTDSMKVKTKEQIRTFLKNTKWGYAKNKEQGIANYKECIATFDKIVCVSNHTKYSLLNYFPEVSEDQVEVRYSPLKNSTSRSIGRSCRKQEDEKYILLLGGNRWIKNSYRGLKALDDLYSRGHLQNIKTVVVGNLSKTIKSELVNNEKYIFKGYVNDDELESLYRDCELFLYPTLNEGFGYPPLEAMVYGRTCIVSGICSLPEICRDAVYYVNPTDIGEIQNRILWALSVPINTEYVVLQSQRIQEKQESDLRMLCQLIVKNL